MTLFQTGFSTKKPVMPSMGDVKVLVVLIEFADKKFEDSIHEKLTELYFQKQDLSNEELKYEDLSFSDYFEKVSFNKLKLSGVVLPVYSGINERECYEGLEDNKGRLAQETANAIKSNKDVIGDLSEYDSY